MTFEPLFAIGWIVVLFLPPAVVLVWQLVRALRARSGAVDGMPRRAAIWAPIRRLGALLLLAVAALGPAIPGASAKVVVSDIDVYLVIDTTTSSNAEDSGDGVTRLDRIREDALAVAQAYGGARYSVITFDSDSVVRLPLVADPIALRSAIETLEIEITDYSAGSSISQARELLRARLQASAEDAPERLRLVFYFGDGEQTRADPPESFADVAPLVGDGAVFGYGTAQGGPMRVNDFRWWDFYDEYGDYDPDLVPEAEPEYLVDPSTGERAISRIDEDNLRAVASQLGVGYQHRVAGTAPSFPDVGDRIGEEVETREVDVSARLYWIPVLPAILLLVWDLVVARRNLAELRGSRPARKRRSA